MKNDKRNVVQTLKELLVMYKHDRFEGRGRDYMNAVVGSHYQRLASTGETMVTHHESKSGETVYLNADSDPLVKEAIKTLNATV